MENSVRIRVHAWLVIGVFACGVLLRLLLAFIPGYMGDISLWELLGQNVVQNGVTHLYALTLEHPSLGIYPPLHHYALGLVGWFYQRFFSPAYELDTFTLHFLMKLFPNLMECLIAAIAYEVGWRLRDKQAGLWAATLILLNPGLLAVTAYWGMFGDAFYVFLAVTAVWLAGKKQYPFAMAFVIMSMQFKPQGIIFLPLVAWLIWRFATWRELGQALLAGVAVFGLIWLPFIIGGTTQEAIGTLRQSATLFPVLSANAHNIWYLQAVGSSQTFGASWAEDSLLFWGLSARWWGLLGFGLAYLLGLSRITANPQTHWRTAAYIAFSFFILNTQMHENYSYPAVVFLAFVCWHSPRTALLAGLIALTATANVFLHDWWFDPFRWWTATAVTQLTLLNSALNTFLWLVWSLTELFTRPTPPQPIAT